MVNFASPASVRSSQREAAAMINGKRVAVVMPAYNAEKTPSGKCRRP
jgi:hypothetical protein